MTVCIGVLCDDANCVIVASDRMTTAIYPPMEFEHKKKKIHDINDKTVCLTAGDALRPKQILDSVRSDLSNLKHPTVSAIADITKKHYGNVRRGIAEDEVLRPRGVGLQEFYGQLIKVWPDGLAMGLDKAIATRVLGVHLLVCGFDNAGAHIYLIADPGTSVCYDALGYMAVGIGMIHAMSIVTSYFDGAMKEDEALKLVLRAKRTSEIAPGVGTKTDMAVVNKAGIRYLTEQEISALEKP